jgi:hypothetical protein
MIRSDIATLQVYMAMASVADSLGSSLKHTTREPLFVHPKFWSEAHLQKLRVCGFDKNVPLEHVIQRSLSESHERVPSSHPRSETVLQVSIRSD